MGMGIRSRFYYIFFKFLSACNRNILFKYTEVSYNSPDLLILLKGTHLMIFNANTL